LNILKKFFGLYLPVSSIRTVFFSLFFSIKIIVHEARLILITVLNVYVKLIFPQQRRIYGCIKYGTHVISDERYRGLGGDVALCHDWVGEAMLRCGSTSSSVDPDPSFHFDKAPDPTFHVDAVPDPVTHEKHKSATTGADPPRLHCESTALHF
jgi:hypothetical protein